MNGTGNKVRVASTVDRTAYCPRRRNDTGQQSSFIKLFPMLIDRILPLLSPDSDQHQISPHHISALDIGHENLTNNHQRSIVFMFKQVLPIRNK